MAAAITVLNTQHVVLTQAVASLSLRITALSEQMDSKGMAPPAIGSDPGVN